MLKVKLALAMVCLLLLVVVGAQNSDVVQVQFLTWQGEISLLALIFLTAAAGCLIGFVLAKLPGPRPKSPVG